jgi:hypothetical protein
MNLTSIEEPMPISAATTLRQMIMGFRTTQLIAVAAKLGLADHLRYGPQTPEQLARATGAEPQALYRVLRALASLGVFAEAADGAFALTTLVEPLQSDVAGSLHSLAILYGQEWIWQPWNNLLYSVQSGRTAFDAVHGRPLFEYLSDHPPAAAQFDAAMSGYSQLETAAILAAYNFAGATSVVDIGGGQGVLLAAILQTHSHVSGVLFDRAPVIAGNGPLEHASLGGRSKAVAGDFFAEVPGGGDIYLLKSVIHDWDDADAIRILRNCRQAISGNARLLMIERVIPEGDGPSEAKLFDINMLVVAGGRERTEHEYRALLAASGFRLSRIIPTQSPLSLIEGLPAPL